MARAKYIDVTDVSKTYRTADGGSTVLDAIDLAIERNEFVCIMGASGCGKSTLMRILGGIEHPDAGSIMIDGAPIPEKTTKQTQEHIGIVFQSDNLLDWRNVYKNVELPLTTFGNLPKQQREERVMAALESVGLTDFRNALPRELSGGMRQRAAIARALVNRPDIMLLDQPFGALDAITRRLLNIQLLDIWNHSKRTCVMVTNSVNEALYLAQRIIVLSKRPASVAREFEVPFSYEERRQDNTADPAYLALREEVTKTVHCLA